MNEQDLSPVGEVPLSLDHLLEHRAWLWGLARGLTRDDATADDLAQDVWLATLEHPPAGAARPWLARVLGNRRRQGLRSSARRRAREEGAARGEATRPTDELAERAELQRRLAQAVLALDPPQREVVLRRYFGGERLAQIARSAGLPESTVRNRLHRARERLRSDLDRDHGGRRGAWVALLARWERDDVAIAAGGGTSLGLVASAVVAVGLAFVGGRVLVHRSGPEWPGSRAEAVLEVEPVDVGQVGPRSEALASVEASEPGRASTRVEPSASPSIGSGPVPSYRIQVLDLDGQRLGGAWVRWRSGASSGEAIADERGLASIPEDAPAAAYLRVRAGAEDYFAVEVDTQLRGASPSDGALEIRLPACTRVFGFVRDRETGLPVPDAAVGFNPPLRHGQDPIVWTRTDAEGRFELDGVPERTRIGFEVNSHDFAPTTLVTLAHLSPVEVLLERGEPVRVRAVDLQSGPPIESARFEDRGRGLELPRCAADGVLRARALPQSALFSRGASFDLGVSAPGWCPVRLDYAFESVPADAVLDVPLLRSSAIEGALVDEAGAPVAGALVRFHSKFSSSIQAGFLRSGVGERWLEQVPDDWRIGHEGDGRGWTGEDGRFRLDGLCPVALEPRVVAKAEGFADARLELASMPPPGGSLDVELVMSPRAGVDVSGRLLLNGEGVRGRAWWRAGEASGVQETGPDGRFEFTGVPPGPVAFSAVPHDYRYRPDGFTATREVELAAEAPPEEVVLEVVVPMSSVRGRVEGPGAEPLAGLSVFARAGRWSGRCASAPDGTFVLDVPMASAPLRVSATRAYERQSIEGVLPGSEGLVLRFGPTGQLRIGVTTRETGQPPSHWKLVRRAGETHGYEEVRARPGDEHGRASLELPAGPCDLAIVDRSGRTAPRFLFGLDVSRDGVLELEEVLEPSVELELRFEGDAASGTLGFLLEEHLADGRDEQVLLDDLEFGLDWLPTSVRYFRFDGEGRAVVRGLGPGRFRVLTVEGEGRLEPARIDVVEGGPPQTLRRVR